MTTQLEQPAQDHPVAWLYMEPSNPHLNVHYDDVDVSQFPHDEWFPVYTRPQPVPTSDTSQDRVDETAKQRHEPVAWMNKHGACMSAVFKEVDASAGEYTTPLYTRPQAREWVGLTDEELAEFSDAKLGAYDLCLEVEAKLKEKNT